MKYVKYVKENPNHLLLKTINTFQKFDLRFKIFYITKKNILLKLNLNYFLINEYRSTLLIQRPRCLVFFDRIEIYKYKN
jgi:hypothetical protein